MTDAHADTITVRGVTFNRAHARTCELTEGSASATVGLSWITPKPAGHLGLESGGLTSIEVPLVSESELDVDDELLAARLGELRALIWPDDHTD